MKWWLLFFAIFIGSFFGSTNCNENRIIGGELAPNGIYQFLPHLWSAFGKNHHEEEKFLPKDQIYPGIPFNPVLTQCSSTIISARHILTDAHCVVNAGVNLINRSSPVYVDVRPMETMNEMVNNKIPLTTQLSIPSKIYIHRGFNQIFLYNDIAILEYPEYVNFNYEPIKLAKDYTDNYKETAIAAGYGLWSYNPGTNEVDAIASQGLRHVNVSIHPLDPGCISENIKDNKEAINEFKYVANAKNKICAGNRLQRVDHGDSGGPLLLKRRNELYQIGLAEAILIPIEDVAKPAIYTRISSYCPWIEKVTKDEVKCVVLPPPDPMPQPQKQQITTNDAMALNSLGVLLLIAAFKLLF